MEFNAQEVVLLLFATIGPLKATLVYALLTAEASPEFSTRAAFRSVLNAVRARWGLASSSPP